MALSPDAFAQSEGRAGTSLAAVHSHTCRRCPGGPGPALPAGLQVHTGTELETSPGAVVQLERGEAMDGAGQSLLMREVP